MLELESGHSSSLSLPSSRPMEKCFHIGLCYSSRAARHMSLLIFFSHLVKCMNSAFLFDYLSVCWRGKGGHMKQLCCLCPRGMSTWSPVRQMWACSAHSLRSTQCHTQVLPCCRSQLPPAMELPMKNPGLEPLIKPKI